VECVAKVTPELNATEGSSNGCGKKAGCKIEEIG